MSSAFRLAGLTVRFPSPSGWLAAARGVSWSAEAGRVLAIVGESGSGKSVSVLGAVGLLPKPPAEVGGHAFLGDVDLSTSAGAGRRVLGGRVGMVFQDPLGSLNPFMTVGRQVWEVVRRHTRLRGTSARSRVIELFGEVGIPSPATRVHAYPHELSGGQRQRVLIAMGLAGNPEVLIADEPTTALDVTVQAQILQLFNTLCEQRGLTLVIITHDMGVVATVAHRVVVMYAGEVVEENAVDEIFATPKHPYTRGLMASIPGAHGRQELLAIPGFPPDPRRLPEGCAFAPRCPHAWDLCRHKSPRPRSVDGGGRMACHMEATP